MLHLPADWGVHEEVVREAHEPAGLGALQVSGVAGVCVLLAVGIRSLGGLYSGEAKALVPDLLPVEVALPMGYVDAEHHLEQGATNRSDVRLRARRMFARGALLFPELFGRKDARAHPT